MREQTRLLAVALTLMGLTACSGVAASPPAETTGPETVTHVASPTSTTEASPDALAACTDADADAGADGDEATLEIPVETVSFAFDTQRIEGPRHCEPFVIVFTNHDAPRPLQANAKHDIDIRAENVLGPLLFDGSLAGTGTTRFEVPGLPAGEHYFYCSVAGHEMSGTLVVAGG